MVLSKLKIAAALLATVALVSTGAGVLSHSLLATENETALAAAEPTKASPAPDFSAVDKRIQEIEPTAKEKRFDEIGWAKGLCEAERLAKENNRPVFLFCNVGQMDLGRC